jgi:hypothetical protein
LIFSVPLRIASGYRDGNLSDYACELGLATRYDLLIIRLAAREAIVGHYDSIDALVEHSDAGTTYCGTLRLSSPPSDRPSTTRRFGGRSTTTSSGEGDSVNGDQQSGKSIEELRIAAVTKPRQGTIHSFIDCVAVNAFR